MNLNYSKHRLEHFAQLMEYKEKLGKDVFSVFVNTVYSWLMKMNIGEQMNISVKPEIKTRNRDLFIKVACLFISEGNEDYIFSEDYTIIIRYDRAAEIREVMNIMLQIEQKRKKEEAA